MLSFLGHGGERPLMAAQPAAFARAAKIERRARKISDPIERLKYLRGATLSGRKPVAVWGWAASLALAAAIGFLGAHDALSRPSVVSRVSSSSPSAPAPVHAAAAETGTPVVWPVEQTSQYDLYSNGLRVENALQIANLPRSYSPIARESGAPAERHSQPAGIVFHMTESRQESFQPSHTAALKRIGENVLLNVRNKRAYHFVIDRFGRVHRIVVESDTANHAGNSVWADSQWLYVDLNESFIGVAFEASAQADEQAANDPQLHAAKLLTDMLRAKYNLPAENCVTHAQVSVNPENMRIGWHTDWGTGFAFRQLGLPDNYETPDPAIYLFGFEYDQAYLNATGPGVRKGLAAAEQRIRAGAAERGLTVVQYRKILQRRYKEARSFPVSRQALPQGVSGDRKKKNESI